jgi:hypothetical protein
VKMQSGGARTRRMTAIFSEMKAKVAGVIALLDNFEKSDSPGIRLSAIAVLQMFPSTQHLNCRPASAHRFRPRSKGRNRSLGRCGRPRQASNTENCWTGVRTKVLGRLSYC